MFKSLALFTIAAIAEATEWGQGSFANLYGRHSSSLPYSSFQGRHGYGSHNIGYDSDGIRRSAHDKDGDTYGHENSPHDTTEFGEKDKRNDDDADYGFTIGGHRGSGYGRRNHQELDLDDDRRAYGGYGYGGYGGYGRGRQGRVSYGSQNYGYDSDGPRRSVHDKDVETYGHENSPHGVTELGEKDKRNDDDADYGFTIGGRRGYGYGGRRHQELDLDDDKRSYGGYGLNRGYGSHGRRVNYGW